MVQLPYAPYVFCEKMKQKMSHLINAENRNERSDFMQRFNLYLPKELLDRIKLMAKFYNYPTSKMMVELMKLGYIRKLGGDKE